MSRLTGILLLLPCLLTGLQAQELSFFETFADHAILQRDVGHPVWGWAAPKAKVTLTFKGQEFNVKADKKGRWQLELPPQPAGGPHVMMIRTKLDRKEIIDLYFGDVYLLSGQSNMEWQLRSSDPDGSRAIAIGDPLIREVTIAKSTADQPENHLNLSQAWRTGTAANIGGFSAVGSYFAHYLRADMDVPIGLIHSSWGGSRIEPWMPAHLLGLPENAGGRDLSAREKAGLEIYHRDFGEGQPPKEDRGEALGYLDPNTDYSSWPTIEVPGTWESKGYPNVNGHFYYARYFNLTAEQAAGEASLQLGAIDDSDWTYVNGQLVGEMYAAYSAERVYKLKPGVLKAGKNVLLLRVEDTGGGGGLTAGSASVKLVPQSGKEVALAGSWHYRIGSWSIDEQLNQVPVILYNKMIHPLAGMPLSGVLWYQGESNAGPGSAEPYADQFKALITYWRQHFKRADLPFYWVQLANFQEAQEAADEEGWGVIRASQTAALELGNTGEAVIIDIGEADDIHPRNKWEVGRRLSLLALKNIYGKDVVANSPRVVKADQVGRGVRLTVANEANRLEVRNDRYGYTKGFVYRNQRGEWNWATAELLIGGKTIMVRSQNGDKITAVRYGYANNPSDANVYNDQGLPLTPFSIELK